MKNNLTILVIICTLFVPISCASTKKQTQPHLEYSDDPSVIFPCSEKTPPPDLLSPKQIDYLYENDLWNRYYNECINPPTRKEGWIVDTEECELYDEPSFFARVLARPASGTKVEILGNVKDQYERFFYLIEYTDPENQVMKGYVFDGFVATEKFKKPFTLRGNPKEISVKQCLLSICVALPPF